MTARNPPTFLRDLGVIAALAVVATGSGLAGNAFRREPLPWVHASKADRLQRSLAHLAGPAVSPAPPPAAPEMIDLARFHDLVESGAPVLDARPAIFYRAGHVPGARGLSRAAFETDYARWRDFLASHREETLAVYCAGDECEDSRLVAAALQKLGYARVLIFQGGWDEWRRAGLPEERP